MNELGMARSKDSAKEIKDLDKCGQCTKLITDRDNGLQCDLCDGWFHAGCQDVTDDDYKALNKLEVAVHWYCKTCNIRVQKVMGSVARLQNRMEKVEAGLQELKNELPAKIQEVCVQVVSSIRKELEG